MADFDETNKGIIFLEEDKKTEKSPDYTGKVNVEGAEFRVAGWKRVSKNGKPFISLAVSDPEEYKQKSGYDSFKQAGENLKQNTQVESDEPINLSDIPF